jgi:hypothetical protein
MICKIYEVISRDNIMWIGMLLPETIKKAYKLKIAEMEEQNHRKGIFRKELIEISEMKRT